MLEIPFIAAIEVTDKITQGSSAFKTCRKISEAIEEDEQKNE
jgi:hypothetical protein